MKVYHGSNSSIPTPSISHGRIDTDFGLGFYTTLDYKMAEKWACRKKNPVITEYELDLNGLSVYEFPLNSEWLHFVISNRGMITPEFDISKYDILIGATADDKMFATIEQYELALISENTAIEVLNCMHVGKQLCLKTENAINQLHFQTEIHPSQHQILSTRDQNAKDRKIAAQLTTEIIKRGHQQNKNHKNKEHLKDVPELE